MDPYRSNSNFNPVVDAGFAANLKKLDAAHQFAELDDMIKEYNKANSEDVKMHVYAVLNKADLEPGKLAGLYNYVKEKTSEFTNATLDGGYANKKFSPESTTVRSISTYIREKMQPNQVTVQPKQSQYHAWEDQTLNSADEYRGPLPDGMPIPPIMLKSTASGGTYREQTYHTVQKVREFHQEMKSGICRNY